MTPVPLTDKTRTLGKPSDMTDEECSSLDICDVETANGNYMVSAWRPDEADLKKLNEGEPVFLWIRGLSHPVVSLST